MTYKKILIPVLLFAALINIRAAEEKYGKEITIKEITPLSNLLAHPEKYINKTILIEGKIIDVCSEKGCWIDIAGESENQKIKVKVEDGVIVFPQDSKGKTVLIQGILIPVAGETCSSEPTEKTECSMGSSSCCTKSKKEKIYQINCSGAVIK
jgi:hypothetical protein